MAAAPPRPGRRWLTTSRIGYLFAALLGLVAAALWSIPLTRTPDGAGEAWLPWWAVALVAAACELVVLHLQVRREAQAVSLSEIGIVLSLFFATPAAFVVGRLLGASTVYAIKRRQQPVKVLFNGALCLAESTLALLVFHAALPGRPLGPAGWFAALLACAAVGLLAGTVITAVIGLVEGSLSVRDLVFEAGEAALTSAAVAVPALVAVHALASTRWAALPLAGVFVLFLFAYRGYRDLSERHLTVSRLYRLTQVVGGARDVDDVLGRVLTEAAEVLRAERVEITLAPPSGGRREAVVPVRYTLGPDGALLEERPTEPEVHDPAWLDVLGGGAPFIATRRTRDPRLRAFLRRHALRDALCVPLRADAVVVGTLLVGDRFGEVRSFDAEDARLLETVANHCCIALENGYLLDRLRHDALHDNLTGLPNRAMVNQRLGELVTRIGEHSLAGLVVVILDLVGFKEINDTLGHQVGDQVLRETAHRLRRALREEDLGARLGGDEFALLLPGVVTPEDALARGEQLRAALADPIEVHGVSIEIGASIGMCVAPLHGDTTRLLLTRADAAMYEAKSSGTGLVVYEPGLETTISPQRLALAGELRRGIETGELQVHVQPLAATSNGAVVGAEALVRWRHPTHGTLLPDDFVALAERTGLIGDLTRVVLQQAIAACGRWHAAGWKLGVAVNLSARSILDPGLFDTVAGLLRTHGVPPEFLTLEITESSIVGRPARALRVLNRMRAIGVQLALDDFGTGYSSLSYLRELPVQSLKIDKRFVSRLAEGGEDAAIVRSIVDLAGNLGLGVVAEGVEDGVTWDLLAALGCDRVQGFHVARPMPADGFLDWLAAHPPRTWSVDLRRAERGRQPAG